MRLREWTDRIAMACCFAAVLLLCGCTNTDEQAQGGKSEKGKSTEKTPKDAKDAKPAGSDAAKPADAKSPEDKPEGDAAKPKEDEPRADAPADAKPADADKPADTDKPDDAAKPSDGDVAKTPGEAPAADAPSGDEPAIPEVAPPVRPDLDIEGQMRLIVDMVNRPRAVRKTSDFVAMFVALADGVIASDDASPGYKSSALLAKFKVLHEAACDGNDAAQAMLVKVAEQQRESTGARTAEWVRFVDAEKKLLDAKTLDAAELPKLLEDTKAYLADEELSNRQLRMAQLATQVIERLPPEERDAWYKTLGEQFARSVDMDLAYVGQRLGKPPVPPSALLGKPFELSGKLTSGQDLKWENYRDKIVLVDFWATWCTLCLDQEPRMKDIHAKYYARGLEIVGVSIDADKEALTRYLRDNDIPWITLFGDKPQEVAAKYGVRGVPTMFLIDAEGKILMRSNSIAELEPHIKTHVEALEKKRAEKKK